MINFQNMKDPIFIYNPFFSLEIIENGICLINYSVFHTIGSSGYV